MAVLLPTLLTYVNTHLLNFSILTPERKALLQELADYIISRRTNGGKINLVFICTHNSRRSHISQLWAQAAASYYGIENIYSYSGGTEATAFNPRAVKAMKDAGFKIDEKTGGENPRYSVTFSTTIDPVRAFSKVYDDATNPTQKFCAVMTCSHADENCPYIPGVEKRIALTFDDPKEFDNTPLETEKYAERVKEMGCELFYAFSLVEKYQPNTH
jgi:hypothetical protein